MNQVMLFENNANFAREVQEVLQNRGYKTILSRTADEAHSLLSRAAPHVALVNLNIQANRGIEILKYIREARLLTTPIAMLDSRKIELVDEAAKLGCRAFIDKGHNFLPQLEDLLQRIHHQFAQTSLSSDAETSTTLEVLVNLEEKALSANLACSGSALSFSRTKLKGNTYERIDYYVRESQKINDAIKRGWRPEDNRKLYDLGNSLTKDFSWVLKFLADSRKKIAPASRDLRIDFGSEIDLIGLPMELLLNKPRDGNVSDYLSLKHSLLRRVARYKCKEPSLSIQSLWGQTPLNVLLIAANTWGKVTLPNYDQISLDEIPAVEVEIAELDHYFNDLRGHLIGEVRTLAGPEATYAKVKKELEGKTRWHILHFAGHGVNYSMVPEFSGLVLCPAVASPSVLYARELKNILKPKPPRLICLNACEAIHGFTIAGSYRNSYAILDALLKAKVPQILGSRWRVEDDKAGDFALVFYRELFQRRLPVEWALLKARQEMWEKYNQTSPIWASPVLVSQVPAENYSNSVSS